MHGKTNGFDLLELAEMGLDEAYDNARPLVLAHHNVDAKRIEDVKVVPHNFSSNQPVPSCIQQSMNEGFIVLSVLCLRSDSINYGETGCAAVEHKLVTVLVKLKALP